MGAARTDDEGVNTSTDVACFGELLWDFYEAEARADGEPIARRFRREVGGTSANVALALARLGLRASAVGAVGEDPLGAALVRELAAEGVETAHVVRSRRPTGITFVTDGPTGAPSFFPYRGGTADLALGEGDVAPEMAAARFALVSTTGMLPGMRAATLRFLDAATHAGATLVVDLNVRAHLWPDAGEMRAASRELAARAALVKGSERDLGALAGKRGMTWLEESAGEATWILTRGDEGAAAVGAHGQVTATTKRVRCVDRSGGGDAFIAGVLAVLVHAGARPGEAAWKEPKLWARALEVGQLLGAKAVAAMGATAGLIGLDEARARARWVKKG